MTEPTSAASGLARPREGLVSSTPNGTAVPQIQDSLFELKQEALRCPHQAWARIRQEEPVAWNDQIGCFLVTRYDDLARVLQNPEVFSNRSVTGPSRRVADGAADPE